MDCPRLGVTNESRSPIIPIIIGEESAAVEISRQLQERGIFVPGDSFPDRAQGQGAFAGDGDGGA